MTRQLDWLSNMLTLSVTPGHVIASIVMVALGLLLAHYKQPPTWRYRLGMTTFGLGLMSLTLMFNTTIAAALGVA